MTYTLTHNRHRNISQIEPFLLPLFQVDCIEDDHNLCKDLCRPEHVDDQPPTEEIAPGAQVKGEEHGEDALNQVGVSAEASELQEREDHWRFFQFNIVNG